MSTQSDKRAPDADKAPVNHAAIRLGRRVDWAITAFIFCTALVFIWMLQSLSERATAFPWFITVSIVVVSIFYAYSKWNNKSVWDNLYDTDLESSGPESDTGPAFILAYRKGVVVALGSFVLAILLTMVIGPVYAVPIFVFASLVVRKESPVLALLSALILWAVLRYVFGQYMSLNLPTGYLIDLID